MDFKSLWRRADHLAQVANKTKSPADELIAYRAMQPLVKEKLRLLEEEAEAWRVAHGNLRAALDIRTARYRRAARAAEDAAIQATARRSAFGIY